MVRRKGERGFTRVSWDEALDSRRRTDPRHHARPRRPLPDRAGHHERGVLHRAEGGALHRHEQRRQRGARVSRAVDVGAEGGDRRRRHDVLVPRRDRERSHRAVRRRRRERAAGVHEVPVPREAARGEDRGRQPVPRTGARALLGAVERRERDVRHEDDRRVLLDPHRRRRRVRQRRAEGAAGDRRHRPGLRQRAHARFRRAARRARGRAVRRARDRRRARRAPTWRGSRSMYAARGVGGARVVDGRHPARLRRRQRARDREPRSGARQRRPARRGADADPRPLRRAGRRGDGLLRHDVPRRRADHRRDGGRARRAVGLRRSRPTPGLTAAAMVDAARHGDLDVLWSSGGNFLDVLPAPDVTRTALGARRAARPPGHRVDATRCSSIRARSWCCCPRRRATSRSAAERRPRPSGGSRSVPRSPAHAIGEARSEWQIFADIARRVRPEQRRRVRLRVGRRDPRRDRARRPRVRGHREAARRPAMQIQVGGERLCEGGVFPTPDGRAHVRGRRARAARRSRRATSCCRPAAASSSTRWCGTRSIRSPARKRDALFLAPADAAALGVREGDAVLVRSPHGEMRARVHLAPIRPGNVQAFFPEANPLLAPARRDPISGVPDYNAVVEVVPRRMTSPDALLELFVDVGRRGARARSSDIPVAALRDRTDRAGSVRARPRRRRGRVPRCWNAAPVRIVSEESGVHERAGATITVVLDPVDGSTNCSRADPVLGHVDLRARRRRRARRPRRESGDRRVRHRGARRRRVPRRRAHPRVVGDARRGLDGASHRLAADVARRGSSSARSARPRSGCARSRPAASTACSTRAASTRPGTTSRGYLACVEAGAVVRDAQGRDARHRRHRRAPPTRRGRYARARRRTRRRGCA